MSNRRLIEDSLPLAEVSEQSAREKSIRHGHISTIHMWWARRPLAASRAAIFAAAAPAPRNASHRTEMHSDLANAVRWENIGDARAIDALKRHILPPDGESRLRLLDPFGGGGAIPLEGLRLGMDVVSNDLNPIAHLIQRCTLRYPQKFGGLEAPIFAEGPETIGGLPRGEALALDFEYWCQRIAARVQKKLASCYSTSANKRPGAYIWVRTMTCRNPACRGTVPIFKQTWLSQNSNLTMKFEFNKKTRDFSLAIGKALDSEDPGRGTITRDKVECPYCSSVTGGADLRGIADAEGFGERMVCVVESDRGRQKEYRTPHKADLNAFAKSKTLLADLERDHPTSIPAQDLPYLRSIFNVHVYGIRRWRNLFNARQLLVLATLAREISAATKEIRATSAIDAEYADAIASYLTLMLGRTADYNSAICRWVSRGEFVANTFARQALGMVWDYSEVDPFAGAAGSWDGAADWIRRVILHTASIPIPARLTRGSATRLEDSEQYDLIVTDPPYYDAVPYADLSDFFYVWARICLRDVFPDDFATELTPKREEAVQLAERNPKYSFKTKERFEELLTESFVRCRGLLKDEGVLGVMFAHKATSAWETAISSLLKSGFVVTASWPLDTEMGARLRSQDSAALASSVLIVCRKRSGSEDGFIDDVEPALTERLHERLDYFWTQGIRGADFFMSAIGPAVEVFGRFRRVLRLSGDEVTIADLLDRVRTIVSDYALQRIVHGESAGNVDHPSRFYVIWRWAFGTSEVEAGEAIHMAQSMGCEFDVLVADKGVLNRSGDKVNLKGPIERKKIKGLGEPAASGTLAPLIDVLHRAANLWATGERQDLADFLAAALPPGGVDRMQRLGQSIVDVLPPGDKERSLYENFLVGARSLPTAAKKDEAAERQRKLF